MSRAFKVGKISFAAPDETRSPERLPKGCLSAASRFSRNQAAESRTAKCQTGSSRLRSYDWLTHRLFIHNRELIWIRARMPLAAYYVTFPASWLNDFLLTNSSLTFNETPKPTASQLQGTSGQFVSNFIQFPFTCALEYLWRMFAERKVGGRRRRLMDASDGRPDSEKL